MRACSAGKCPYGFTPSTRSPRARFRSRAARSFRTITFLEFPDRAEHLANRPACRIVPVVREVDAVGGDNAHPDLHALTDEDFLNHQVAGEAVGALDEDGPHAIGLEAVEQRGQAGAVGELFGPAHAFVAVFLEQLDAVRGRILANRHALTRTHRPRSDP